MTSASPDWYDDPDRPGQKRYWDGSAWTEHRTDYPYPAVVPVKAARRQAARQDLPDTEDGPRALVVAGVLGGAAVMIAFIVLVVVWFDSYNTGHARGEQARDGGIPAVSAGAYCDEVAKDISAPGSADGYWDFPWVWGCKRALG